METKQIKITSIHDKVIDTINSYYSSIKKEKPRLRHLTTSRNIEYNFINITIKVNGWEKIDLSLMKYLEKKDFNASELSFDDDDGDDDNGKSIIRELYYLNIRIDEI